MMRCQKCGGAKFTVTNTRERDTETEIFIVRQRRCEVCAHREEWHERRARILKPIVRVR